MPRSANRHRSSDQRNVLYDEPSTIGILVAIGVLAVAIAVVVIVVYGDLFGAP